MACGDGGGGQGRPCQQYPGEYGDGPVPDGRCAPDTALRVHELRLAFHRLDTFMARAQSDEALTRSGNARSHPDGPTKGVLARQCGRAAAEGKQGVARVCSGR